MLGDPLPVEQRRQIVDCGIEIFVEPAQGVEAACQVPAGWVPPGRDGLSAAEAAILGTQSSQGFQDPLTAGMMFLKPRSQGSDGPVR